MCINQFNLKPAWGPLCPLPKWSWKQGPVCSQHSFGSDIRNRSGGLGWWNGRQESYCEDTLLCLSSLWSAGLDPAETVWKVLTLHLKIIHLPPSSISQGYSTSVNFQDLDFQEVCTWGLEVTLAITNPTWGVRAVPPPPPPPAESKQGNRQPGQELGAAMAGERWAKRVWVVWHFSLRVGGSLVLLPQLLKSKVKKCLGGSIS